MSNSFDDTASPSALSWSQTAEAITTPAADISATPMAANDSENELTLSPGVVAGEVHDFLRAHERRRRQFPRAAIVGLLAGLVGVAFRRSLDFADHSRDSIIAWAQTHPSWGFLVPIALGAAGAGAGVWMVQRYAPEASGSGIPHLKAVLHRLRSLTWQRILPVKFFGGVLSIGGGLTLGREGPTIQMGGALGQMVSGWFSSTARERQTLIAAGSGAGLAAAFNAPLAGLVFVLEELQRDFTPTVFTATFVACVIADVVTRLLTDQLPVFHIATFAAPAIGSLPLFLVVGALAGILGVAYNRALLASLQLFSRLGHWPRGAAGALAGAIVGIVGWWMPQALGGGHSMIEATLGGSVVFWALPLYFVLRFGLTMLSYGTGAPGGIFAPLLILGAQIGLFIGLAGQRFFPGVAPDATIFAVVGMAAYFTAIVRAPLTGVVLIIEMTGNYNLMLPLLAACFSAYAVADLLQDRPIYEALLERDLLRTQEDPVLGSMLLLELPVLPGAAFEGRLISELGLPNGCLIVTVDRGMQNLVATPGLRLEDGDRITAVIAPEAAAGAAYLRENTEPQH